MTDDVLVCVKCGAPRDGEVDGPGSCRFCGARYASPPVTKAVGEVAAPSEAGRAVASGAFVFVAAFGVLWTVAALSIGAPVPFAIFGLLFAGFALYIGLAARRQGRASRAGGADDDDGSDDARRRRRRS